MPELTPGAVVRVSPLVRRVLAPNPGIYTGPGTNTYLIGSDQIAVVDRAFQHPHACNRFRHVLPIRADVLDRR